MDIHTFIGNYREAFGQQAELPIVFWYSDQPEAPAAKVNGCFFKSMAQVRNGKIISLNAETIGCGGGKFYTGFHRYAGTCARLRLFEREIQENTRYGC